MLRVICMLLLLSVFSACAHQWPDNNNSDQVYYTVGSGETMGSIAYKLKLAPGFLRRANPWLNPVKIKPGMRLLIPSQFSYIWPLSTVDITSHYGQRNGRLHKGIDLKATSGTPLYASAAGEVVFSGYMQGYGNLVVIDHGQGIETAYAHNNHNLVSKDQRVEQGQIVAKVGRTGNATGNHVHFEFRMHGKALDPISHVQPSL